MVFLLLRIILLLVKRVLKDFIKPYHHFRYFHSNFNELDCQIDHSFKFTNNLTKNFGRIILNFLFTYSLRKEAFNLFFKDRSLFHLFQSSIHLLVRKDFQYLILQ